MTETINDTNSDKLRPSLFKRCLNKLIKSPQTEHDLNHLLHQAEKNNLLDQGSLKMMEGVIEVANMKARDIMVPRAQMVMISEDDKHEQIMAKIIDSGHSRFPIENDKQDKIVGILLAKDLLNHQQHDYQLDEIMRPAIFIPESKRLTTLLKEFRETHHHLAVVADEYGEIAGLVTIEDVIEQIVGEIEDEHDLVDETNIYRQENGIYLVKATTPIDVFNQQFNSQLDPQLADTIAGLIVQHCNYLPKRHETIKLDRFQFTILQANQRRIELLELKLLSSTDNN